MSEEAKVAMAAAHDEGLLRGVSFEDIQRIKVLIDAKFVGVFKERDDLEGVLRKLVKAIEAYDLDLTDPHDYEMRVCNLTEAVTAAKKLTEDK